MEDTHIQPAGGCPQANPGQSRACPQARQDLQRGLPADSGKQRLKVLVLMGGPSAERTVSLASGQAVCRALQQAGFEVIHGDIGPDDLTILDEPTCDVVFPVLHGTFGEDGQLQTILEQRGLAYCGSDARASALAMDKHRSRQAFIKAGLLCAPAELIGAEHADDKAAIDSTMARLGLPCVVKPNAQGSSVGITIATEPDQARQAVQTVLRNYGDCLVERFIEGRELTVGIMAGQSLPVLEVKPAAGFYDYHAKYEDNQTEYLFETNLGPSVLGAVEQAACRAFEALGCRDFARVDFIVDAQQRPFVLEVNTIPGFTDHSLLPKAADRAGIVMCEMCRHIVQMAWQRRDKATAPGSSRPTNASTPRLYSNTETGR